MSKPKTAKSPKAHRWIIRRGIIRPLCRHCGLVALRNDLTARAIKAPCPDDIDLGDP